MSTRLSEFVAWPKTPRWSKAWAITEKIDGTNACIAIDEVGDDFPPRDGVSLVADGDTTYGVRAASRRRWITPNQMKMDGAVYGDNFGFAAWVADNADRLVALGTGRHFGEWYGQGIQRGYRLNHRRFALFSGQWQEEKLPDGLPDNVDVVPLVGITDGPNLSRSVAQILSYLDVHGSHAVPGRRPEGIIIQSLTDRSVRFKALLDDDNTAVAE